MLYCILADLVVMMHLAFVHPALLTQRLQIVVGLFVLGVNLGIYGLKSGLKIYPSLKGDDLIGPVVVVVMAG